MTKACSWGKMAWMSSGWAAGGRYQPRLSMILLSSSWRRMAFWLAWRKALRSCGVDASVAERANPLAQHFSPSFTFVAMMGSIDGTAIPLLPGLARLGLSWRPSEDAGGVMVRDVAGND